MSKTEERKKNNPSVAYFCMEYGLENGMKEYAGGLGILAGDTVKAAADLELDFVGIGILYKNGYFKQELSETGEQLEVADTWPWKEHLENTGKTISFEIRDATINAEIWKYQYTGVTGHAVQVYFLNTDIDSNPDRFKYISFNLYTPYEETRLLQELTLGIGGVYALRELGYEVRDNYHLNESHAAFGILALEEILGSRDEAKKRIVFTTHTPAEHGHKKYYEKKLNDYLTDDQLSKLENDWEDDDGERLLHLTRFNMRNAKFVNAVAKRHGEVSRKMFPEFEIDHVTNGVHLPTWAGTETQKLLDTKITDWKKDSDEMKKVNETLSEEEVLNMHSENKKELIHYINNECNHDNKRGFSEDVFTIGFGRRVDLYKRSGFIFRDVGVLKHLAEKYGGLQIVMAGKAYFNYEASEKKIYEIFELSKSNLGKLKVVYIPDYSMNISQLMVQGCDIWLNNPLKPLEASGTSGMKAALNGVPNFSTVDGWWVEGWEEGITGWSIGDDSISNNETGQIHDLYSKLDHVIMPMFANNKSAWASVMKNAMSKNASFFSAKRMVKEYLEKGYSQ